jgi:two-component system cell cycle response regulator DivK
MGGEPVLIVDDNELNLKMTRALLTKAGYDVRTASDSSSALGALTAFKPRLILMDIQLPGVDGLELTRAIKSDPATQGVKILAVTAYSSKGDEAKAMLAGCDGYVTKPIDTRALPGIVRRHLDGPAA